VQFLFGPVKSRRLGNSLGVNLFHDKICNLDCLYCEAGKTLHPFCENEYYVESSSFKEELSLFLGQYTGKIDYITFSGKGEPTLCKNLKEFIDIIRELTEIKIGIITNGILLEKNEVRDVLMHVDMVMPSLDSAQQESFEIINRPCNSLNVEDLIQSIEKFSLEYTGELFLEIMLLSGINCTKEELQTLKIASNRIRAQKVFLNVLDRAPAYLESKKLTHSERELVKSIFNESSEILL